MNLYEDVNGTRTERQSQLVYYVPDGGVTVAMLGFVFAGLSAVGRRLRKA